jgi:hypothetical protein
MADPRGSRVAGFTEMELGIIEKSVESRRETAAEKMRENE